MANPVVPSDEEIRFLPDTPVVYLSIMRTKAGKPVGMPIWSSFDHKSLERSMENESMASTFLSLSKSISDMATDEEGDGKIVRLNINQKTYNIFLPHPEEAVQVCFVVVFEDTDDILIKDEYKTELVKIITDTLHSNGEFIDFVKDEVNLYLKKGDKLYDTIFEEIIENIKKWDKKRVQYLKKKEKERLQREKERLEKEAQERAQSVNQNNGGNGDPSQLSSSTSTS